LTAARGLHRDERSVVSTSKFHFIALARAIAESAFLDRDGRTGTAGRRGSQTLGQIGYAIFPFSTWRPAWQQRAFSLATREDLHRHFSGFARCLQISVCSGETSANGSIVTTAALVSTWKVRRCSSRPVAIRSARPRPRVFPVPARQPGRIARRPVVPSARPARGRRTGVLPLSPLVDVTVTPAPIRSPSTERRRRVLDRATRSTSLPGERVDSKWTSALLPSRW